MVDASHPTVLEDSCGIGNLPRPGVDGGRMTGWRAVDESDHYHGLPGEGGETINCLPIGPNEVGSIHQIFRRVSGDRQFGCQEDIGALSLSPRDGLPDPGFVSPDVTNVDVDLCPGNTDGQTQRLRAGSGIECARAT